MQCCGGRCWGTPAPSKSGLRQRVKEYEALPCHRRMYEYLKVHVVRANLKMAPVYTFMIIVVAITCAAWYAELHRDAMLGSAMMRPPSPVCSDRPDCVSDFVRLSGRVWEPPPVWTLADYTRMFGGGGGNLTLDRVRGIVVASGREMDAIDAIYDTWGTPGDSGGMRTIFVTGEDRARDPGKEFMHPQGDSLVVVPDFGVSADIALSYRNMSGSGSLDEPTAYERQQSILTVADFYAQRHQHRMIKAIRYIYEEVRVVGGVRALFWLVPDQRATLV